MNNKHKSHSREIFADEGEAYFRSLERDLVKKLAAQEGQIISTGGGIVLQPENISDFEKQVWSAVYMRNQDRLLQRLEQDTSAPY